MSTAVMSLFELGDHFGRANVTNSLSNAHNNCKANNSCQQQNQRNNQVNQNSYSVVAASVERKNTFPGCVVGQPCNVNGLVANNNVIGSRRAVNGTCGTTASVPLFASAMHQKIQHNSAAAVVHANPTNGHNGLTYSVSVSGSPVAAKEHKKLDRSMSEPAEKLLANSSRPANQANSSRYKTELCRPFEENGTCKYGDKCQFAHGYHELRNLQRHPKYKTELCRTFHSSGFCPYGPRCHFIHNSDDWKKSVMSTLRVGCPTNSNKTTRSETIPILNANAAVVKCESVPSTRTFVNPIRPKALSIGSYSLGSSGDLSQPSSPSGSPTSLSSFFAEDTLGNFTPHSTTSNGNGSFSFSPDFFVGRL